MEIEAWHLIVVLCVYLATVPVNRWLKLKEREIERGFAVRELVANAENPDAAVSALSRLEAAEAYLQTQQAQEEARAAEPEQESITVEGRKFTPVISFEDLM